MRKLRIVILVVFLVTSVMFGITEVKRRREIDNTPPVVSADNDYLQLSVSDDESAYLQGVSANDDRDGDVTSSIVIASKSKFTAPGKFKVKYAAFDSHNNVGYLERYIIFTDYRSPRFSSGLPFRYVNNGTMNSAPDTNKVTADDVVDGDISDKIRVDYGYSDEADGSLPATFEVSNSFGDVVDLSVTYEPVDQASYNLAVPALDDYILYCNAGEGLDIASHVNGVLYGTSTSSFEDARYQASDVVVDTSGVDFNTAGTYQAVVSFSGVDASVKVYVVVEG